MTDKIAIIGFGNIASAIITPLLDNKLIQPENVFCVVNTEKSLENIKKNYKHNINVYKSGSKESKIIWDCQYKLLSIKPQQLNDFNDLKQNQRNQNALANANPFEFMNNSRSSKVVGMPGISNSSSEVSLMEPRSFDEMPKAIQALRERKTVILNLTMMDPDQAQRAVDFIAGGTYAIDGHQERVGESIFLFAPS